MKVKVKFFANFREKIDEDEIFLEIDKNDDIKTLLKKVIESYPNLSGDIFENNELRSYVNIFHNHRNIKNEDGLSTNLEDNDTVAIFPPVSGG